MTQNTWIIEIIIVDKLVDNCHVTIALGFTGLCISLLLRGRQPEVYLNT